LIEKNSSKEITKPNRKNDQLSKAPSEQISQLTLAVESLKGDDKKKCYTMLNQMQNHEKQKAKKEVINMFEVFEIDSSKRLE